MQNFEFNTVARIVCGPGSALDIATQCQHLGVQRPLLMTDTGLVSIAMMQPV